ncbi:helix-turn-helix domain-containing protein [Deinococcus enclensis]|uniref:DNA-binding Lrp family transcriptional regulator n=1 Tax=Deinococcus enclensis TaxID=1049582 RepID=A0ABT9MK83_9DEIO|nr:helix-turn-helix domain-containing protein [Deinococcus enclensis]MDP9766634.1 DNA-binding Lrp family transcriptional regulator [Deinococcus enclensis]
MTTLYSKKDDMPKTNKISYVFTAVPMSIIDKKILKFLSGNEFKVYFLLIAWSRNFKNQPYTTLSSLSKELNLSRKTVIAALKKLEYTNLIKKTDEGVANKSRTRYEMFDVTKEFFVYPLTFSDEPFFVDDERIDWPREVFY